VYQVKVQIYSISRSKYWVEVRGSRGMVPWLGLLVMTECHWLCMTGEPTSCKLMYVIFSFLRSSPGKCPQGRIGLVRGLLLRGMTGWL